MGDLKYVRVVDMEKAEEEKSRPPPEYAESTFTPAEEMQQAPTHFLKSILASILCCLPAGLAGLFFSAKTHCANQKGDNERAKKYSRWAKKFVILAVVLGIAFCLVSLFFHVSAFAEQLHQAKHSFRDGLVNGISTGKLDGIDYGMARLANNDGLSVTLPNPVPSKVNVFDVRKDNPFWAKVRAAVDKGQINDVAKMFGEQFGWAHGFKLGFCGVEGTDCKGVELNQSKCPFKAVFGKSWKHGRKHGKKHCKKHGSRD